MAAHTGKRRFGTVCALLGAALACAAATGSARAGEVSEEQIAKALTLASSAQTVRNLRFPVCAAIVTLPPRWAVFAFSGRSPFQVYQAAPVVSIGVAGSKPQRLVAILQCA